MKIFVVVISFNPQCDLLFKNISTYCHYVNNLIIVDNSTDFDKKRKIENFCQEKKYIYLDMNGNKGIAAALNAGFEYAKQNNVKWVLTMDQDSYLESDLEGFKFYIQENNSSNIILLVPKYAYHNVKAETKKENLSFAIQSGNLVNVNNYKKIGSYRNDYFIDFVDYEYCLRARSYGLILKQVNSVILNHEPGTKTTASFLGIEYNYFESAPFRYYYVVRNGLNTGLIYKDIYSLGIVVKIIARIILMEKNKIGKIKFVLSGILDFFKSKFGELTVPIIKNKIISNK